MLAINFKGHSDHRQCERSSQRPQCHCPSAPSLLALLRQAKTHRWARGAHLASHSALHVLVGPSPGMPRRCLGPLLRKEQQTQRTSSGLSPLPASQRTASALPHGHQTCCLDATCFPVVPQSGVWEAKPPWEHSPGLFQLLSLQALRQRNRTEPWQLPSSQRLKVPWQPAPFPPGFCRRARCFSWEDSLQHPSACSPASWQGSSVEGKPLPTRGAQGNAGGGEQEAKEVLERAAADGRERAGRCSQMNLP